MSSTSKVRKKPLKRIPTTALSRGWNLAKLSISAGAKAASYALQSIGSSEQERTELFRSHLLKQAKSLTESLGQLKGSLMKAGQMLSVYGEHFLPTEVNAALKSLQVFSHPLEWNQIEKVLIKNIGKEVLSEIEIEKTPYAAASLGQVHLATRKRDGKRLAIKVQYPGIAEAIDSDLNTLKSILKITKIIPTYKNEYPGSTEIDKRTKNTSAKHSSPKHTSYDDLFDEVREMLKQEVDYKKELESTDNFRNLLKDDTRYIVPKTFPEYSNERVLVTEYEPGLSLDDPQISALSQKRRNSLGRAFGELGLRELWDFHLMQTDAHFGNYRIRLGNAPSEDRIILFDFGAVRAFPKPFIQPYLKMTQGAYEQDPKKITEGALALGFLRTTDGDEMKSLFCQVCILFTEPFHDLEKAYDWGSSTLPKRVSILGTKLAMGFRLRPPPREIIFIDRKLAGTFTILSQLGVKDQLSDLLKKYLYN